MMANWRKAVLAIGLVLFIAGFVAVSYRGWIWFQKWRREGDTARRMNAHGVAQPGWKRFDFGKPRCSPDGWMRERGSIQSEINFLTVWGASPNHIFAAGDNAYHTGILSSDGVSWSKMPAPQLSRVEAIWGASVSDVWAVTRAAIFHYDGLTWNESFRTRAGGLMGIWGASASDIVCVGSPGLIFRYNGQIWSQEEVPDAAKKTDFAGVWGAASNDIYAVGAAQIETDQVGLVCHYDGEAWRVPAENGILGAFQRMPPPNERGTRTNKDERPIAAVWEPHAIWGSGPSDIYAVGEQGAAHFDGRLWSPVQLPEWKWKGRDKFAFGPRDLRFDPAATFYPPEPNLILRGIWGASAADVYAVGKMEIVQGNSISDTAGVIFHYDGKSWRAMNPGEPYAVDFTAVWGSSAKDVYVVGYSEMILHYDGKPCPPTGQK